MSLTKVFIAIGLAAMMLWAAQGPVMGAIVDHNSITYVKNTPTSANTPERQDSTGDELADGVAASAASAHNAPEMVYWLENDGNGNQDLVWDGTKPDVTFNLGSTYSALNSIDLWYGGRFDLQGPKGMTISFSPDDTNGSYTTPVLYNSATYPGPLNNAYTTVTETIGFNASNFQYVKIEFDPQQGDFMSLGEVTFDGDFVIPEPSTWTLIAMGLIGLAAWIRQKR